MAGKKILIVEDETIEALDIKKMLESFGYDVPSIVLNGETAVETAKKIRPDLILMDIILKGELDGISAAKKIQELNIPIIFLMHILMMKQLKGLKKQSHMVTWSNPTTHLILKIPWNLHFTDMPWMKN